MQHQPKSPSVNPEITQNNQQTDPVEGIHNDLDDFHLATPSSQLNDRPSRKSPRLSAKKIGKWKVKGKPRLSQDPNGECYLLDLPQDVLHSFLCKLAPRSLVNLSATCILLHKELEDETIWRHSYVNHYLWDGASRSKAGKADVQLLVQGCLGTTQGWRQESLSRETMLNRWITSKAAPVSHQPHTGLIMHMSLYYPPPALSTGGKPQPATPTKSGSASTGVLALTPTSAISSTNSTPSKMTHRQKYEALLAANTRPAPYVLSAGLDAGAVVRSDPLSGKVSKGYWGPDPNANLHLRTRLNGRSQTSAVFVPSRTQTYAVWGLINGTVTHTSMQSKHSSTPGTRANSINTACAVQDMHDLQVLSLWAPESTAEGAPMRFVSGGADGRVKYWQLDTMPAAKIPTARKSQAADTVSELKCLFTSGVVSEPLVNRPEDVRRRQGAAPDGISFVRCDPSSNTVCGITDDGDLRIWFDCSEPHRREVRIDAGSEADLGPVGNMDLAVSSTGGHVCASVLVHHRSATFFQRFDVRLTPEEPEITTRSYVTPGGLGVILVQPYLEPTPPISLSKPTSPTTSIGLSLVPATNEGATSAHAATSAQSSTSSSSLEFGRFVLGADIHGNVHIWPWNPTSPGSSNVHSIRSWDNHSRKITLLSMSNGIVAVGSADGYIKIYDPLPSSPTLLRSFRASHLSPADVDLACSDAPHAPYYTPNRILLDNDMLVASIGHKVFAWRAGSGKGRQAGKGEKKSGGKSEGKAHGRTLDLRSLHAEAADDQALMEEHESYEEDRSRAHDRAERQHLAAMDNLGLEGDEALQYALMLSMEEQGGEVPPTPHESLEEYQDEVHHYHQYDEYYDER